MIVPCLDMDGVIVDFIRPALKLHGRDFTPTYWLHPADIGLTNEQFLEPMTREWWADLPKLPLADELVQLVCRYDPLVVTHAETEAAVLGKRDWLGKHYPQLLPRLVCLYDKHLLASPRHLLIDDKPDNILRFKDAGGNVQMWPQPWNGWSEHYTTQQALEKLQWRLWSLSQHYST